MDAEEVTHRLKRARVEPLKIDPLYALPRDNILNTVAGFAAPDVALLNNALKVHACEPEYRQHRERLVNTYLWRSLNTSWHGVMADAQTDGAADAGLRLKPMIADVLEYYIAHNMTAEFVALQVVPSEAAYFLRSIGGDGDDASDVQLAAHDINHALFPALKRAYKSNERVFSFAFASRAEDVIMKSAVDIICSSAIEVRIPVQLSIVDEYVRTGNLKRSIGHDDSHYAKDLVALILERDDAVALLDLIAMGDAMYVTRRETFWLIGRALIDSKSHAPECARAAARFFFAVLSDTLVQPDVALFFLNRYTESIFLENMEACEMLSARRKTDIRHFYNTIPFLTDGNCKIIQTLLPSRQALFVYLALVSCRVDLIPPSLQTREVDIDLATMLTEHRFVGMRHGHGRVSFAHVQALEHHLTSTRAPWVRLWRSVVKIHPDYDFSVAEWEIFLDDPAFTRLVQDPALLSSLPLTPEYNGIAMRLATLVASKIAEGTLGNCMPRADTIDIIYNLFLRGADCLAVYMGVLSPGQGIDVTDIFLNVAAGSEGHSYYAENRTRFVDCVLALFAINGAAYLRVHRTTRQSLYLQSATNDSRGLRRIIAAIEELHHLAQKARK